MSNEVHAKSTKKGIRVVNKFKVLYRTFIDFKKPKMHNVVPKETPNRIVKDNKRVNGKGRIYFINSRVSIRGEKEK